MSDPIAQPPVQCTYADCDRTFQTEKQMKRHKKNDPDHDYCSVCDEDFPNEHELFLHKVRKDIHNICPICTLEFGSAGGLDIHIRQCHRTKQEIVCQGCQTKFSSASAIMVHIEKGQCGEITLGRVLQEQAKKLMIKEALKSGEGSSELIIPSPDERADDPDHDGGVSISLLDDFNHPATPNKRQSLGDGSASAIKAHIALSHLPSVEGDLMDFDDNLSTVMNKSQISGWEAKDMSVSGPISPRPFGVETPTAGQTISAFNPRWDATKFFNSLSGQYVCSCGQGFEKVASFEEHLLEKAQKKQRVRCPGCNRFFNSMSALVAHCEVGGSRCDINTSSLFGQIMDEMTGGVVQVAGYHEDGTLRYEAGQLELQPRTTVGVKW